MSITKIWPVVVALGLAGCGAAAGDGAGEKGLGGGSAGNGEGDPEIEMRCQYSAELAVMAADGRCACLVEAGEFVDQETCRAEISSPQEAFDCVCPIYAMYPESNAFIDCLVPLQEAAVACAADALCDERKLEACTEAYQKYVDCPLPEAAVEAAAMQCDP